jgi:hypothetical protein
MAFVAVAGRLNAHTAVDNVCSAAVAGNNRTATSAGATVMVVLGALPAGGVPERS